MKTLSTLLVVNLLLQAIDPVANYEDCKLVSEVPKAIELVTKWLVNGFTLKNSNKTNVNIVANCMAGLLGKVPFTCYEKKLSIKTIPNLPKTCSNLIIQGHLHNLYVKIANAKAQSLLNALESISYSLDLQDPDDNFCIPLVEYVRHRTESLKGGKYDRKKMYNKYCKYNQDVCEVQEKFFNNSVTYMRTLLSSSFYEILIVFLMREPKYGKFITTAAKTIGENYYLGKKISKGWSPLEFDILSCIAQFFKLVTKKLGTYSLYTEKEYAEACYYCSEYWA